MKKFVSLFSGCGGLDLGFVQQGFTCSAAFDWDATALATHKENIGGRAIEVDLSSGVLPAVPKHVDIVLAGSPCQGFSTVGKRELDDPRNSLLLAATKIGIAIKPKIFLLENVPGALSGSHRKYWEAVEALWKRNGYSVSVCRISCDSYGVGQRRLRVFLIAAQGGEISISLRRSEGQVLRDALRNIDGTSDHAPILLPPASTSAQIAARIGPGQKLSNVRASPRSVHTWNIPEVFGRVTNAEKKTLESLLVLRRRNRKRSFGDADPVSLKDIQSHLRRDLKGVLEHLIEKNYVKKSGRNYDLTHTFNGKYRRLTWNEPSPTVDTKFGEPRLFLHPSEDRGFTVREAARLQGFPDSFIFRGSDRQKFQMIGNAVPPPVAATLAAAIRDVLNR